MGSCVSGPDSISKQIDKTMNLAANEELRKQKLMLLGSGSSGKSTIFKQLNYLYSTEEDMPVTADPSTQCKNIRESIVDNIAVLIMKAAQLYEEDETKYANCKMDYDELEQKRPEVLADLETVFQLRESFNEKTTEEVYALNLGPKIETIWALSFIKGAFTWRRLFHLADNIDHFLDRAKEVFDPQFKPQREDILRARIRTTGLVSTTIKVEDQETHKKHTFEIWDAGGQRNERAKWIHQFEGVTGLIFVAALNHFNQVLFEDEKVNALHESLEVYETTVNDKVFDQTEVILFLNKSDLFEEDLRKGDSLSICFTKSDKCSWEDARFQWDVANDYQVGKYEDEKDEAHFKECYEKASDFIKRVYESRSSRKAVFPHITCATNRDNVQHVFWDVQTIVIRANLKRFGLLTSPQ